MHAELGSYEPRSLVLPLLSPCHARYLSHELIKNEPAEEEAAEREETDRHGERKWFLFRPMTIKNGPSSAVHQQSEHGGERDGEKDELYQDE